MNIFHLLKSLPCNFLFFSRGWSIKVYNMTVPIFQIFLSFMYELATKKSGFFPLPEFPTAKSFGGGGFSLWSAGSLFAVHILLLFCHLGSRALTGSAVTAQAPRTRGLRSYSGRLGCFTACGILVPQQGIKPEPPAWQGSTMLH